MGELKGWTRILIKKTTVEGHQGKGRPKFDWLDGMKRALAVREVGLQEVSHFKRERERLLRQ